MDVDAAADQLYAVVPEEFTALRDGLVRRARDAGDRALAGQLKALRRPTTVAWLANQLAREHAEDLSALLELGGELRQATAAATGADLRTLSRQRSAVVQALVRQARNLARSRGRPVPETVVRDLEQTLLVALADPLLADRLEAGRLTEKLEVAGFDAGADPSDPPHGAGATPRPRAGRRPQTSVVPGPAEDRRATELRRAERQRTERQSALNAAVDAAAAAERAVAAATQVTGRARGEAEAARQTVAEVRAQLDRATDTLAAAESAVGTATSDERRAAEALAAARDEVGARRRVLAGSD